ncbi:Sugar transferase involved in LPS biosynthesis (colanic, teichoic acid) [Micromonospora nigra]|uniref:Sugar transferase involved in LPS biosynthesis (Colanic, teichoic acid) n=1 Tax=Micromonospora nigra TaxID=145857 RepID=A0A1C6SUF2_9ACTN|nr:sugar transferase [Micromonospora nigra]SCL32765.1 Sugar transferase involved in LPS biosynthesis (colanic, teichoic acid) [Micromonospora nigra]
MPATSLTAPVRPTPPARRVDPVKRLFDVVLAAALLLLTAPLMAAVAVVVAVGLGRPVLFRQRRVGRDDRLFELVKFRSMREPDPARGLVSDADRLTPLGRWLRASSLDELPTLWNVLRGDMSIVGPRPLLPEYLGRYSPTQARRHEVRPGVTGLAQVRGRNSLDWDDKLALDVEYVDRRSLRLDLSILVATVRTVLGREGISATGSATAPEFLGSRR